MEGGHKTPLESVQGRISPEGLAVVNTFFDVNFDSGSGLVNTHILIRSAD